MSHDLLFEQAQPPAGEGGLPALFLAEELAAPPKPRRLDDKLAVWQRDLDLAEADSRVAYLQTSMSVLSALGAELSAALEQRNRDYESLRARVASLLPELPAAPLPRQAGRPSRGEPSAEELAELAVLRSRAESAIAGMESLAAQKTELAVQLRRHTLELEQLGAAVGTAQSDLQTLYDDKVAAERQLADRMQELEALHSRLEGLEAELSAARADRSELETQLAARSTELGLLQHRLGAMEAALESAHLSRDDLQAQLAEERESLAAVEERSTLLAAQLHARDEEMLDIETQAAAIRDHLLAALGEPDLPSDGGEEAGAEGAEQPAGSLDTGDGAARRSALDVLGERVTAALARLREQDEGLAATLAALAARQEEIVSLDAARSELESRLATQAETLSELEGQRAETESSLEELDTLKAQLSGLRDQLEMAGAAQAEQKRGEEAQAAKIAALVAAAAATAAELRDKDDMIETAAAHAAEVQQQLADLAERNTELETAASAAQNLQAEFEGVLAEKLALAERVQALESERADFRARLEGLQGEIQAAGLDREKLIGRFRAGQAELGNFRKQVEQLRSRLALADVERESLVAVNEKLAQANAWSERLPGLAEFVTSFSNQPPMKTLAAELAVRTGTFPTVTGQPQDLLEIDGITSVFERKLYREGIGTYWELAHLPDEDLTRILGLTSEQLAGLDLAALRTSARHKAEETSSVGRLWSAANAEDLARLEGVNTIYQQKLYKAGICSYAALANAAPEQLAEIIGSRKLEASDYQSWIDQAREMVEQRA